jgi:hypothetical protein
MPYLQFFLVDPMGISSAAPMAISKSIFGFSDPMDICVRSHGHLCAIPWICGCCKSAGTHVNVWRPTLSDIRIYGSGLNALPFTIIRAFTRVF